MNDVTCISAEEQPGTSRGPAGRSEGESPPWSFSEEMRRMMRPTWEKVVVDFKACSHDLEDRCPAERIKKKAAAAGYLQIVVQNEEEKRRARMGVLMTRARELTDIRSERAAEIGPVLVAFPSEDDVIEAFFEDIVRFADPFWPVPLPPVWQTCTGLAGIGRLEPWQRKEWRREDCGYLAAIEEEDPAIWQALLREHAAAWERARARRISTRAVEEFVFVGTHGLALDWANRGLSSVFAHPDLAETPAEDRWWLAREVHPRLLVWVGDDMSDIEAFDGFAETVMVTVEPKAAS